MTPQKEGIVGLFCKKVGKSRALNQKVVTVGPAGQSESCKVIVLKSDLLFSKMSILLPTNSLNKFTSNSV